MNKKVFAVVILLVLIMSCALAFAACGDKVDLAGKRYYLVQSDPKDGSLIYVDTYYIQFWNDGKTCQLRNERPGFESVKTGDYVRNGNTVKISWLGSAGVEEWKIITSRELYFDANYRIKPQQD